MILRRLVDAGASGDAGEAPDPATPAEIATDPAEITFGQEYGNSVVVGATEYASLLVLNKGQSPLTITGVTLRGPSVFEATLPAPLSTGQPLSLDGEATTVIEVTFTPTTVGDFEATLTVASNAANAATKVIKVSARSAPPSM